MRPLISLGVVLFFGLLHSAPFSFSENITGSAQVSQSLSGVTSVGAGKVTLDLKGIDIIEALKILATQGSLDMIIGGNIQGRVTLYLNDVEIEDAIEIILLSNGLAYDRRGGIFYVMTQRDYEQIYGESFGGKKDAQIIKLVHAKANAIAKSLEQTKTRQGKIIVDDATNSLVLIDHPDAVARMKTIADHLDRPMDRRIFELKYAKAEDMKAKITEMLTKDVGVIEMDERTNKISVRDVESNLDQIQNVVNAFDEKPKQVLIEAKIVQVTLTDAYKLGVDWNSVFTKMQKDYSFRNKFSLASVGTFPSGFSEGAEVTIGTIGVDDNAFLIQALKTVGDANLLSSPRITALNNQEAKILVGESRPYATNTVVTPAAGATTTASTLSFLDIGIKLYVTPSISSDGFITMKIKPEVSSATDTYTYGDPVTEVPIVSTTQAETSVTVKDGRTIIIAGLVKDERSSDVDKVPLIGDIPLLSYLFRKTEKSIEKQELVIFITPHIVNGESDYLDVATTPPFHNQKFSVPEKHVFERRNRYPMDPNYQSSLTAENTTDPETYMVGSGGYERMSTSSTPEQYYYSIKDRILDFIQFDQAVPAGSRVLVTFRLASNGQLISEPLVVEGFVGNLPARVSEAVKRASPFEPFPQGITVPEKDFTMEFIFQ